MRAITSAGDPLDAAEDDRLRRLSQILTGADHEADGAGGRPSVTRVTDKPGAVLH